MTTVTAYLALGSNLGDRARILHDACALISERAGKVTARSDLYETDPEGFSSDHRFLNQAIAVCTELNPLALLAVTMEIERELGRTEKSTGGIYRDRSCDIDIILYGPMTWDSEGLQIPHPRFRDRLFVLRPLAEIAPEAVDPITGNTITELYHGQTGGTRRRT